MAGALRIAIALLAAAGVPGCLVQRDGSRGPGASPGDADGDVDEAHPDADRDGCEPSPETCNGLDDDCDGRVDEGFDLARDPDNCGSCGNRCAEDPPNASEACVEGSCVLVCDPGFADCSAAEGCESRLSAPSTCGSCEVSCAGATPLCAGSLEAGYRCASSCTDGLTGCGGSCVDLETDTSHCGRCDRSCPTPANARASCAGGECGFECDEGWGDCLGGAADGCETHLTSTAHCGECGAACPARPNATATCTRSGCAFECLDGWGDCLGDPIDGCETDLRTSDEYCGSCETRCFAPLTCVAGDCQLECPAGCACSETCSTASPCSCASGCPCTDLTCASDCAATCSGTGTLCVIDATRISNFNSFNCNGGADCEVDLRGAGGNFESGAVCSGSGTRCFILCDGMSNCYPRCDGGARCLLECGSTANCGFAYCDAAGGATSCGGGTWLCNASCP